MRINALCLRKPIHLELGDADDHGIRWRYRRPWCWEGWGAGGEGDDRGWDGWMASLTRWKWVWVNSGSWWWTGRPGVLRFMGLLRVGHDWVTELNWTAELRGSTFKELFIEAGDLCSNVIGSFRVIKWNNVSCGLRRQLILCKEWNVRMTNIFKKWKRESVVKNCRWYFVRDSYYNNLIWHWPYFQWKCCLLRNSE